MDKIMPLPGKKVIKALESMGFEQVRQKGSHLVFTASRWKDHNSSCASHRKNREGNDQ